MRDNGEVMTKSEDDSDGILNLSTLKHFRPYKLQWLNDCGEVRVDRQVLVMLPKYQPKRGGDLG